MSGALLLLALSFPFLLLLSLFLIQGMDRKPTRKRSLFSSFLERRETGIKTKKIRYFFSLLFSISSSIKKMKWKEQEISSSPCSFSVFVEKENEIKKKKMSASFPFLTHEMDEEAHFLLSFSPYISFLEERGRWGKKESFDCVLSSLPLSFILSFWRRKRAGMGGRKCLLLYFRLL